MTRLFMSHNLIDLKLIIRTNFGPKQCVPRASSPAFPITAAPSFSSPLLCSLPLLGAAVAAMDGVHPSQSCARPCHIWIGTELNTVDGHLLAPFSSPSSSSKLTFCPSTSGQEDLSKQTHANARSRVLKEVNRDFS